MLFAEIENVNIWAVLITSILTSAPVILGLVLSHIRQMAEIRANTKVTQEVVEHVDAKVDHVDAKTDSAVRAADEAKSEAKKITDAAAAKVGLLIGKALSAKAERVATKVAEVAIQQTDRIAEAAQQHTSDIAKQVETVVHAVKGENGTCLTSQVAKHGEQIKSLNEQMETVKSKVGLIEGDTKQILEILQSRGAHI